MKTDDHSPPDFSTGSPGLPEGALASILAHMLNGVCYCRLIYRDGLAQDFEFLYTNPAFHSLTGIGEVIGQRVSSIVPGIRESDPVMFEIYQRVAQGGKPETFVMHINAMQQWFSVSVYSPQPDHFVSMFDIITDVKESAQLLQAKATQLQFVLEGSDLGFWDWQIASGTVMRNERWATMLGYTYEEIQHTTRQWSDFIHPEDRERAWASIFDALEGRSAAHKLEYRMLHKDGSIRWILDQAKVMERGPDGSALRMCGTHTDVTERKAMESELSRQAHIDDLTGVSNRRDFIERAEQEIRRARRYDSPLSLFMLDIDHFKQVNDRYGHKVGDLVLKKLPEVCRNTLRDSDILGRLGGEEFAVLLPQTGQDAATEVAERLRKAIADARVLLENGIAVQVTVSIGVAALADASEDFDALLLRADTLLYKAKHGGRNQVHMAEN